MIRATPQDTYDHTFGSGAMIYEWWHRTRTSGVQHDGTVSDDWAVIVTADDGNDSEVTVNVTHGDVMRACRIITQTPPKYVSQATVRECRNLIFHADEADFDAVTGDELLQVAVLGEVVFG